MPRLASVGLPDWLCQGLLDQYLYGAPCEKRLLQSCDLQPEHFGANQFCFFGKVEIFTLKHMTQPETCAQQVV